MNALLVKLLLTLVCLLLAQIGKAQDNPIRLDIRLMGADLVDELVFDWLQSPPNDGSLKLVLAEVNGPVGLDDRFATDVENRLYELIRANPTLAVELIHCAVCRRFVVKSTKQGTLLSRGIEQPEVLAELLQQSPQQKALALHFEAGSRELILRAEIFSLAGHQPIVWAKRYSTSMTARRILRDAAPLVSLETARNEQRKILEGDDGIEITTRLSVRQFQVGGGSLEVPPLVFIEQSLESLTLPDRRLRAAGTIGFTSIRESIQAWSAGGHVAYLLYRNRPSLVDPDFYWFLGFHYLRMRGPGAAAFGEKELDVARLIQRAEEPKATLVAYRLGLEAHIKYRLGMMAFLEHMPLLKQSEILEERQLLGIPYHAFGIGMVTRW